MQTMTKRKQYRFFNDPGHGWLEVEISELQELGIMGKITSYSYQQGRFAYLEEDCDFSTFAKAKEEAGQKLQQSDIVSVYQDRTPIRGYASFKPLA